MVQGMNSVNGIGSMGLINRVGNTNDGRAIYQLTDETGKSAGKISVPQAQSDVFEKSFNEIMVTAPKIQDYTMKNSSPEAMEKRKKATKWIIGGLTAAGFGLTVAATRKMKPLWQWVLGITGTLGGLVAGVKIAANKNTPPGAKQFAQATQTISKLDIQPYQG